MPDMPGKQLSVKSLLDTGAVVKSKPISFYIGMEFDRSDLITSNIRLAAVKKGVTYVAGGTSLQLVKVFLDKIPSHRESGRI